MRILIVADNASSRFGGEAFLPFNYFRLMRGRNIDVRLLVHERNKPELTAAFPNDPDRLYFVRDTVLHKLAFRLDGWLPRRVAALSTGFLIQLSTQFAQRRKIAHLSKIHDLDVVHVPTPVSPKAPSLIYGFSASVVVGPLNGGMEYPKAFRREEGMFSRISVALGRGLANFLNVIIPGKRKAELILVANCRTREALPRGITGTVVELVENGVDFAVWRRNEARAASDNAVKFVFVGRLVDWKAVEIVLEALQRLRGGQEVYLEIIGDGPMRESWQALSKSMGLQSVVKFSGWMSQKDCAARLQQADAFLLPSLFECGGAVVLEAMAMGLPVIATAWGGPLDYLDESCGILIPPTSRESLIAGFSAAMGKIAESPILRHQLGQAGYERAKVSFDWESKIDRILEMYALAIQSRANRTGNSIPRLNLRNGSRS
jgi:glycosyltransferase involved in cell wall biosynthesis